MLREQLPCAAKSLRTDQALVFFKPKRIAIRGGYHGCHETIAVYKKSRGEDIPLIDLDDEYQAGDLCWLETPVNPLGESRCAWPVRSL